MRRLSLRARLFLMLMIPLFLVASTATFARFLVAERMSEELYDNTLLVVALTISRDVVLSEGDVLTEELLDRLTNALGDPVYYRITGPGGSFVTGYSDPPPMPEKIQPISGKAVFYDSLSLGKPVRAVVLNEFISEPQFGGWVTVEVWQNVSQRAAFSRRLVAQSLMLLGSVFLTATLILWFGIKLGLKPVADLREAIGARSPDDLRPIRRWIPPEMRPLVDTTNSLFQRLAQAISLRDAFISDAAHQVRNPIAAIQAQAEAALTAPDEATLRARVSDVASAARDTGRLTNQLLSIERVRGRTLRALSEEADLVSLISEQTRAFAEAQLRRAVNVSFEVQGTPRLLRCDPVMIGEMLANLLDNAAKYGARAGGEVRVALIYSAHDVTLRVSDDGPGIPPDLRIRIFDRFFRNDPDQTRGCGLGLSIVEDVAKAHGGQALCLDTDTGATFEVRLPA